MGVGKVIKNVGRYFSGFDLMKYCFGDFKNDSWEWRVSNIMTRATGPLLTAFLLTSYVNTGVKTDEWNFYNQIQANIQRNDMREEEEKRKRDLYSRRVFGEKDFNVLEEAILYSSVSVDELERADESYKLEAK